MKPYKRRPLSAKIGSGLFYLHGQRTIEKSGEIWYNKEEGKSVRFKVGRVQGYNTKRRASE